MNFKEYHWSRGQARTVIRPFTIRSEVADMLFRIERQMTTRMQAQTADLDFYYDFVVGTVAPGMMMDFPDRTAILALAKNKRTRHETKYVFWSIHTYSLYDARNEDLALDRIFHELFFDYLEFSCSAGLRVWEMDREFARANHPNPSL